MPKFKVLITDYAWPNLDIERRILAEADAELVVAQENQRDAASLRKLAADVDAIMTNWAKVPAEVMEKVKKREADIKSGAVTTVIDDNEPKSS